MRGVLSEAAYIELTQSVRQTFYFVRKRTDIQTKVKICYDIRCLVYAAVITRHFPTVWCHLYVS